MFRTEAAAAIEDAKERVGKLVDDVQVRAREGRRAVIRAQHAVEDGAATLAVRVRRHPLRAIAVSVAAGAFVGGVIGAAAMCVARDRGAANGNDED